MVCVVGQFNVSVAGKMRNAFTLDLVETFTLLSEHKNRLVKAIGQNHQIPGKNSAIASRPTPG